MCEAGPPPAPSCLLCLGHSIVGGLDTHRPCHSLTVCPQVQDGQITHIQYEQGSQFLPESQVRSHVGWQELEAGPSVWSWRGMCEIEGDHGLVPECSNHGWSSSRRSPPLRGFPVFPSVDPVHACVT